MVQIGFDYASVDDNIAPDFARAKAAGARIGIVRSIYGRAVKGQAYTGPFRDPCWMRDADRIRRSGLTLGTYLYLCAPRAGRDTPPPEAQAQALIEYVGFAIKPGDLPPFVDVEEDSTLTPNQYFDWIERACRVLRTFYGTWPGLYTSRRVWIEHLGNHPADELIECPLWIAKPWPWSERTVVHLDGAPAYEPYEIEPWGSQWFLYQYQGDTLQWPGFSSTVDASRFNTLVRGERNVPGTVAWVQRKLNIYLTAAHVPALVVDGVFGANTESALKRYQSACGLVTDGIYGAKTHGFLSWLS